MLVLVDIILLVNCILRCLYYIYIYIYIIICDNIIYYLENLIKTLESYLTKLYLYFCYLEIDKFVSH